MPVSWANRQDTVLTSTGGAAPPAVQTCVVGEQAGHGPHQEQLQVVTLVAGYLQRVV